MRLKASFTVENSFIMPLLVIIIVAILYLCFFLHDSVILKNTALKIAMRAEFCQEEQQISQIQAQGENYLKEKTICMYGIHITIEREGKSIKVNCSGNFFSLIQWEDQEKMYDKNAAVYKNRPYDFIRKVNAIQKIIK